MATRKLRTRGLATAAAAGFGMAVGTVLAMAAQHHALTSLRLRVEQLEQSVDTREHNNLAYQQRQHWELLSKAIDDPELAEVLDLYEVPVSTKQRRQYIFANALYTNLLSYYRIGNLSREEFLKHARGIFQSPIVREYWYATRQQRASISETDEAELGLMVDELLHQLEEADTDEWWVVEPPDTM